MNQFDDRTERFGTIAFFSPGKNVGLYLNASEFLTPGDLISSSGAPLYWLPSTGIIIEILPSNHVVILMMREIDGPKIRKRNLVGSAHSGAFKIVTKHAGE